MEMFLEPKAKRALGGLSSDQGLIFANPSYGEVIPLAVSIVDLIADSTEGRLYEPRDISGWTITAAIGTGSSLPIAGSFTLTYGANTTAAIAFDATAATVSAALNLLASVISAGGVTVAGPVNYYRITFSSNGSRTQITADASNLAPVSVIEAGTLIEGTSIGKEVQTIRAVQSPAALVTLVTDSASADATVTVLQTGGAANNAAVRVQLIPIPYDGQFSVSVGSVESPLINFDASAADVVTALESINTVGAGNVAVKKEQAGQYLISFQGERALTAMGTITASAESLKVVSFKTGNLDLRSAALELLFDGADSISAVFEIEGTPPAGNPQKLYRQDITVDNAIIDPASQTPQQIASFYTQDEANARFPLIDGLGQFSHITAERSTGPVIYANHTGSGGTDAAVILAESTNGDFSNDLFQGKASSAIVFRVTYDGFIQAVGFNGPIGHKTYTVATAPSASSFPPGTEVYFTDDVSGPCPAWSNGTDWRRASGDLISA